MTELLLMKFLRLIATSVLVHICFVLFGQSVQFEIPSVNCSRNLISEDHFGNIFVSCGSQLYAFSKSGKSLFAFGNNNLGPITSVDASNSMKIAVVFGTSSTICFIDNKGVIIGTSIDLSAIGLYSVSDICITPQSNIWFFDKDSQTLQLVNLQGSVIAQSGVLNRFINLGHPDSLTISCTSKNIYIASDHNVSVFSADAAFINSFPLKSGGRLINETSTAIYYSFDDSVFVYPFSSQALTFHNKVTAEEAVFLEDEFYIRRVFGVESAENETGYNKKNNENSMLVKSTYLTD